MALIDDLAGRYTRTSVPDDAVTAAGLAELLGVANCTALRWMKRDVAEGYLQSGTKPGDRNKMYFWKTVSEGNNYEQR